MKSFLRALGCVLGLAANAQAASDRNPFDLIQEALKGGKVTYAESVFLRAQAFWGDAGLPAAYQGNLEAPQTLAAPTDLHQNELAAVLPELSPRQQRLAVRWMAPPAYIPGLADAVGIPADENLLPLPQPDPNWVSITTTEAKIWYLKNDAQGERYALVAKANIGAVLTKLQTLMQRGPLPDNLHSIEYTLKDGSRVTMGNGGDGRLDIYMLPCGPNSGFRAYAGTYKSIKTPDSLAGFLVFDTSRNLPERRIKSVLMHETMHLVQYAFPMFVDHTERANVDEGVAKWSEDHWDSASQFEHEWTDFFRYGWKTLKGSSYDTWTWYFFLVREHGTDMIRKIYASMAEKTLWPAVNAAIPGGFKVALPNYAKKEWNQFPPEDSFLEWDSFSEVPFSDYETREEYHPTVINTQHGDFLDVQPLTLDPLSRSYFAYSMPLDGSARSFSVEMLHYWMKDQIQLKALVLYAEKGWKVEDWNSQWEDKQFCLDTRAERIQKIVLIYTNVDHLATEPVELEVRVKATNLGCHVYKGKAKSSMSSGSANGGDYMTLTTESDLSFLAAARVDDEDGGGPHMPGRFELASVRLAYTYNARFGPCTSSQSGVVDLAGPTLKKKGSLGLYPYHTHDIPNARMVSGGVGDPGETPPLARFDCPGGRSYNVPIGLTTLSLGNGPLKIPGNKAVIQGESRQGGGASPALFYQYYFEPTAE